MSKCEYACRLRRRKWKFASLAGWTRRDDRPRGASLFLAWERNVRVFGFWVGVSGWPTIFQRPIWRTTCRAQPPKGHLRTHNGFLHPLNDVSLPPRLDFGLNAQACPLPNAGPETASLPNRDRNNHREQKWIRRLNSQRGLL